MVEDTKSLFPDGTTLRQTPDSLIITIPLDSNSVAMSARSEVAELTPEEIKKINRQNRRTLAVIGGIAGAFLAPTLIGISIANSQYPRPESIGTVVVGVGGSLVVAGLIGLANKARILDRLDNWRMS